MIDTLILYWQPGSGGDAVHQMLSLDPKFVTAVDRFSLTADGRSQPQIHSWFLSNFEHQPGQWFFRQWSPQDLDRLKLQWSQSTYQTLIIPTHRRDQAQWLKNNIVNSRVIGICYPQALYFSVLQNWVRKVGSQDKKIKQMYQSKWSSAWDSSLGFRLFKDQLQFGSAIAESVQAEWDINIQYGDLLIGRLESLQSTDVSTEYVNQVLGSWLPRQKRLYQYRWSVSSNLQCALGSNQMAYESGDISLDLDIYDKILLQHWCRQNGVSGSFDHWNSMAQADVFCGHINLLGKYHSLQSH